MKSTAKVFLVFGIIWAVISGIVGLGYLFLDDVDGGIAFLISAAVCIGVSIYAIRRLNRAKSRRELVLAGILTVLCANIFAGILMLTMNEYELGTPPYVQMPYGQSPYGQQAPYGQNPYGQQAPYGQNPYGQQAPYGQNPYGQQPPYGQFPYGQNPYANRNPYANQTVPPYGGIYGAPYAAPKPHTPPADTPTDIPTDTPSDTPKTPSEDGGTDAKAE